MLEFLKKKLAQAIESISKKAQAKEQAAEEIKKPEIKEEIQQIIEPAVEQSAPTEPVQQAMIESAPAEQPAIPEKISEPVIEEIKEEIKEAVKPEMQIDAIPKIETAETQIVVKEKKGFFKKLAEKVVKKIVEKKLTAEDIEPVLSELGTGLIEADVAVEVADKITYDLQAALVGREIKRGQERFAVVNALKKSLLEILDAPEVDWKKLLEKKPAVLLFLGFNGSGKTTSIAKIGKWLNDQGHTTVFAAGDTWRKAAIEQLEEHGKRLNVTVIKHTYGADPAAVIYDGIEHSKAKGIEVLMADSAGRTHVNQDLINELKKIVRVAKPDLKVLVMDSLVGNDAVEQSRMFNDAVGVDAVVFTKLDVNQKGGAILSVAHILKKPILFLGTGQEYEDLMQFDSIKFVEQLLAE